MADLNMTPEELEAMLNRAARRGSKQALEAVGLCDENAAQDIREIRSLLDSWRETRRSVWNTTIKIATVALLTFIAGAVWMTFSGK